MSAQISGCNDGIIMLKVGGLMQQSDLNQLMAGCCGRLKFINKLVQFKKGGPYVVQKVKV